MFNCDQCSFKTLHKMTLEKYVKIKHKENLFSETISSFISRLELEHLSKAYREYFKRHGFNREEAGHMEKMVERHGPYYIWKVVD